MEELIIRRKNRLGNSVSTLITLIAWLFHIVVVILAIVTQLGLYNDSLIVLQLLFGISSHVLVQCWQTILVCSVILLLPVLTVIASRSEARVND